MWNWTQKLAELESQPCVVVTIIRVEGSAPREIGAKLIAVSPSEFYGTIGGGNLEKIALDHVPEILRTKQAQTLKLPLGPTTGQCCGGMVEIFFEPVQCAPRLFIFGAGHVGQALSQVMIDTPFETYLIDSREEWTHSEKVPQGTHRVCLSAELFASASHDWKNTYCIVLTHSHALDESLMELLAPQACAYLGLIGSHTKWLRFRKRLKEKGICETDLSRVHCPVGLNLGPGKAPKEVAISIAAQLLETFYAKTHTHTSSRRQILAPGKPQGTVSRLRPALD